ncbi:hypothetical protein Tco_0408308 [Tanacetum coccineum]
MAVNSFSNSLKKSKSSIQLTVGSGDGNKGLLTFHYHSSNDILKSITSLGELTVGSQEGVSFDVKLSLKTMAGNSVSTDLRSRTSFSQPDLPYLGAVFPGYTLSSLLSFFILEPEVLEGNGLIYLIDVTFVEMEVLIIGFEYEDVGRLEFDEMPSLTFPYEALRRDLEMSRAQARKMKVKWSTCRVEIALLESKNKITDIGELGKCHIEKRMDETEMKLESTCMEREIVKGKLSKSYG